MNNKNIELVLSEEQKLTFSSQINEIDATASPFKEIINNNGYFDYKISFDDADDNYSLENALHIKVNVKKVGTFNILLKSEDIDKKNLIDSISALKEMPVTNLEEAKEKTNALTNLFDINKLLFVIYTPKGDYALNKEDILFDCFVFFVPKKEEVKEVKPIKEKQERVEKKKREGPGLLNQLANFFSPIKNNGIHYAFASIAMFLIGITISIGLYNFYADNKLYILFFICTAIGTALLVFVHIDFFKDYKILSNDYILTLIVEYLTGGLSIGVFILFYNFQKNIPEAISDPKIIIIITAVVVSLAPILSGAIGYLLKGKKKD